MRLSKIVKFFAIGCTVVSIAACASKPKSDTFSAPVIVSHAEKLQIAKSNLQASGAKVVVTGETVRVAVPNEYLFHTGTKYLRQSGLDFVSSLTKYINLQQVVSAQIASFAPSYPASKAQKKLATKRSQVILNYLDHLNVDVRLLTAEGDLRVSRKQQLVFKPSSYNDMTIIYFTTHPENWIH